MNTKQLSVFLTLPFTIYASTADSALILEEMTRHTMLESTASVLTTLGDYSVLNPDGITDGTTNIGGTGISWTGSYSDSGWGYTGTGSFGGVPLSMSYSGALSGIDGSDITVTIAGTGFLGSQPLLMNGSTKWFYDIATDDYLTMAFAQEITLGTGGTGAPAGVVAGLKTGAVVGGAATVGTTAISAAVKTTLAEDQHSAPATPATPPQPI